MTNKYLGKIAELIEKVSKDSSDKLSNSTVAKAALIGTAVHQTSGKLSTPFVVKLMNEQHAGNSAGKSRIRHFINSQGLRGKVSFQDGDPNIHAKGATNFEKWMVNATRGKGSSAAAQPLKNGNTILRNVHRSGAGSKLKNTNVILHELGHAKDFSTHTGVKRLAALVGRSPLGGAATAGVVAASLGNEKTEKYAPAIAAVPGVIRMREELQANRHAHSFLKKNYGNLSAGNYMKKVFKPNMAAYGIQAAAAPLAALAMQKYIHKKRHES